MTELIVQAHPEAVATPADGGLSVDGQDEARAAVAMTVSAAFTARESFDVGTDLGSSVSRDYFAR